MVTGGRTLMEDSPFMIMSKERPPKPPVNPGGGLEQGGGTRPRPRV